MMMPANFSAISENELTYVNGGATLADILAPALTVSNWQTFNKNMVTLIGNHFVQEYVDNTIGVLFGGSYRPGAMAGATRDTLQDYFLSGYRAGFGKDKDKACIPIVAMTANAFEEDKREAIAAGMNGHIAKPIQADKLLAMLAEIIRQQESK